MRVNKPERTSIEGWKKYVSNCLVPVYEKLKLLQKVGEYLEQNTLNRSLDKIDPQLLPYFLGGVNENGDYIKGSLARLITYMYGVGVDTKKLANSINIGVKNPYSEAYVGKVNNLVIGFFTFTDVLNATAKQLELLFNKLNVSINSPSFAEIESNARNVDKFIQTVNDYIYRAKLILPMYNYYSFLIVTTRHLPASIFLDSYPEEFTKNPNLGYDFLGIGILHIPYISDKEQSARLGLTGHNRNTVSDLIFKIINNNLFMINKLYDVIENREIYDREHFTEEYYQFMTDVLRKSSIIVDASNLRYNYYMEIHYYQNLSVRICYASSPSYCEYGRTDRATFKYYSTISDMYNDPEIISILFMNGYININIKEDAGLNIYFRGQFGTEVILN